MTVIQNSEHGSISNSYLNWLSIVQHLYLDCSGTWSARGFECLNSVFQPESVRN